MFGLKKKKEFTSIEAYVEDSFANLPKMDDKKDILKALKSNKKSFISTKKEDIEWVSAIKEELPNINDYEEFTYASEIAIIVGYVYDAVIVNLTQIANAYHVNNTIFNFDKEEFTTKFMDRYNNDASMMELVMFAYEKTNKMLDNIFEQDPKFAQVSSVELTRIANNYAIKKFSKRLEYLYEIFPYTKEQHLELEKHICNRDVLLNLPETMAGIFVSTDMATKIIQDMVMCRVSEIAAGKFLLASTKFWGQPFLNRYHMGFMWNPENRKK